MRQKTANAQIIARRVAVLALCGMLALLMPMSFASQAWAVTAAEKQAEAESALQSLNNMLVALDEASAAYYEAQARVEEAQATIDEQTAKIEECQAQLSTRARSMYRSGSSTFLDVIFGSTSFDEFATNWDLLNTLNQEDAELVEETKEARAKAEEAKAVLQEQETLAAQKKDEVAQTASELEATYQSLSAEAAELLVQEQAAAQQTVEADQIVSYDESTGTATLADGSTATVVSWDGSGNAIVSLAMSFVGGSYSWGASDAENRTFDCSGLVQYVYAQNGVQLDHYSESIGQGGTVISASEAQPGDILYWNGHVAIYAGDGMMVSADNEDLGIRYEAIYGEPQYVSYR